MDSNLLITIISGIAGGLVVVLGWVFVMGRKFQIIDDLKDSFTEMKQDIKLLIDRVARIEGRMDKVVAPGSPLSPTELGAKYIRESGLEKILNDKKLSLAVSVNATLPKDHAEYDVQEAARRYLFSLKDDPMMKPVKNYAFQNALEIETILSAGALWLRDDILGVKRRVSTAKEKE